MLVWMSLFFIFRSIIFARQSVFVLIFCVRGENSFCFPKYDVSLQPHFNQIYIIMYLDSAKKQEIFEKYGKSNTDTGSPESQIALFSFRISHLTGHLKSNHKDYSTERALKMLVGKRRRLLDYLKATEIERYRAIIKELGIRK